MGRLVRLRVGAKFECAEKICAGGVRCGSVCGDSIDFLAILLTTLTSSDIGTRTFDRITTHNSQTFSCRAGAFSAPLQQAPHGHGRPCQA